MANQRRRGRSQRSKPVYKWSGLQVGVTDVGVTGVALVLVGGVEIERYGKATVVAVRGHMQFLNNDSDAAAGNVVFGAKLMKLEINDAGTLTGDDQGIDTNEEDIAKRQLWTGHGVLPKRLADGRVEHINFILNVGVFVVLAHPKEELIMLLDASIANRLQVASYIRVLLRLP